MGPFKDLKDLNDLLPVLLFLLPGFVSAGIVGLLAVRKPVEPFSRVIEALIFTMLNLVLFTVIKRLVTKVCHMKLDEKDFFTAGNLLILSACALAIGLAWSYEANNQRLFSFLRKCKITQKTTKPSVWVDILTRNRKFVIVDLKNGRRVYGWPAAFSEEASERSIYLEQATWLLDDGTGSTARALKYS